MGPAPLVDVEVIVLALSILFLLLQLCFDSRLPGLKPPAGSCMSHRFVRC